MKLQSYVKGVALAVTMTLGGGAIGNAVADGVPRRSLKDFSPPPFSWTGLYVGLNAGGAWSNSDVIWSANPAGFPVSGMAINQLGSGGMNGSGFSGGAQIGYNYQINGLVIGAEADWQALDVGGTRFANLSSAGFGNAPLSSSYTTSWLATARLRLGLAFDTWLVYATGGLAWSDLSYSDRLVNANGTTNFATRNETMMGAVFGGGVEWAFQRNWTVRGEFLHVLFSDENLTSVNTGIANASIRHGHRNTDLNILRAAINYKF